jgi:acetyl-CoA acetyltransferase
MPNRRVAIVGAALSDTGRVDTKTRWELHAQAVRRATADAGLTKADIDGLASNGLGTLQPIEIAEYLGMRPTWIDSTQVGGGTWEVMAGHAADAIAQGHADVIVLVYGSTTRADLKKGLRTANLSYGARGPIQFEVPYGHSLIAKYAMSARRHMYEYGTTIEQLAEVAVSARYNAQFNPDAYYRDPLTVDDVLSSKMIADPYTKLQCCIRSDGGCAIILAAEDRVPDTAKKPVWVLGHGQHGSHTTMSEWPDFTVSPAAISGPIAFERAGIKPDEIDLCTIYDAFTYMEMVTLEDLGFCKKGEGGSFVENGRIRLGGDLPTNPDGGGLSACHPGMRGLFLLVEATQQLRHEHPVERQVPDAKLACVSGTGGWFCSSGTLILGVD